MVASPDVTSPWQCQRRRLGRVTTSGGRVVGTDVGLGIGTGVGAGVGVGRAGVGDFGKGALGESFVEAFVTGTATGGGGAFGGCFAGFQASVEWHSVHLVGNVWWSGKVLAS